MTPPDRLKRDRATDMALTAAFVLVYLLVFGGLFVALTARLCGWS
jgi:hypothetical protein